MKSRIFCLVLIFTFFSIADGLFAFGRRQKDEEVEPINPQWVLCITAFDVSAMSPAWQTAGDIAARNIVTTLQNLNLRFRSDEEINFYQDFTLANRRATVARNLATRRNERDLLIFRGDPEWRYERNLRTANEEIEELEEELREIDELAPVAEAQPIFLLFERNRNGIFPSPPSPGGEFRFTTDNRIDAFITGSFTEFHGRIFLEVKMFTRHTNSFSYEDAVLFSSDDFNLVLAEVSDRLAEAVSVAQPSTVIVRSENPDTMVLIDGSLISHNTARIFSPGTVEITAYADNHYPVSHSLELNSGELSEIFFNLTPFALSAFEIDVSEQPGSRVFTGSLYRGEVPLMLDLAAAEYSYVSVVTPEDEIGTAIFRDNSYIRGSANLEQGRIEASSIDFFTSIPVQKEDQRVEDARKRFYRSWGTLWITLPVSLLAAGVAGNHITNYSMYAGYDPALRQQLSNRAAFGNIVTYGGYAAIGAAFGYVFYNIFHYLRTSSDDATPIALATRAADEEEPESEDDPSDEAEDSDPESEEESEDAQES